MARVEALRACRAAPKPKPAAKKAPSTRVERLSATAAPPKAAPKAVVPKEAKKAAPTPANTPAKAVKPAEKKVEKKSVEAPKGELVRIWLCWNAHQCTREGTRAHDMMCTCALQQKKKHR